MLQNTNLDCAFLLFLSPTISLETLWRQGGRPGAKLGRPASFPCLKGQGYNVLAWQAESWFRVCIIHNAVLRYE